MIDHLANGNACSRSASLLAVASGQADLGQPLQGVRLPGRRADDVVQIDRLLQLVRGQFEVTLQERRLADERRGEGHRAEGSAAQSRGPQARAVSITSS